MNHSETYDLIMEMVSDAARNGKTKINVSLTWARNCIRDRLKQNGYSVRKWTGRRGDLRDNWVEIAW